MKGKLYVVSTPIGNLEDITLRAINVLKSVDLIACEDTRTTKKLLNHYEIKNKLTSYHEHNETKKSQEIIEIINEGNDVALVSDAGTPSVSDPGYKLINIATKNDVQVIPVPGVSAVLSALTVSGLATDNFTFVGFLPKTKVKIITFLEKIKDHSSTIVLFESPKRVVKTLNLILDVFGDRKASLSREITKMYEETIRGNISEIVDNLATRENIRGEITLVVEGNYQEDNKINVDEIKNKLIVLKKEGFTLKESVSLLSENDIYPKKTVYSTALEIWNK